VISGTIRYNSEREDLITVGRSQPFLRHNNITLTMSVVAVWHTTLFRHNSNSSQQQYNVPDHQFNAAQLYDNVVLKRFIHLSIRMPLDHSCSTTPIATTVRIATIDATVVWQSIYILPLLCSQKTLLYFVHTYVPSYNNY